MKKTTLTVYDKKGNAVRTVTSEPVRVRFGTIRKLIAIVDPDAEGDPMTRIIGAWDEVEGLLSECFPDLTPEEIDGLELTQVVTCIVSIIKNAMEQMAGGSEKN